MKFRKRILLLLLVFNCGSVLFICNWMIQSSNEASNVHEKSFLVKTTGELSTLAEKKKVLVKLAESKEMPSSESPSFLTKRLRPNFSYTLQPLPSAFMTCSGHCTNDSDMRWKMVIFVKSVAFNFDKRARVRMTWGSHKQVHQASLSVVFVIGVSSNTTTNIHVKKEHALYGDILQYNGSDVYSHITLKTLAGMQWASDNLPLDSFYSSADDDFIVVTESLVTSVNENSLNQTENEWPEFPIICGFVRGENEKPVRFGDPRFSKWAVSKDTYKWPDFPVYCHGGLYTTSVKVIQQLYDLSRSETILRLDDVWITGILRWKLGIPDTMVVAPKRPIGFHLQIYKSSVYYVEHAVTELVDTLYQNFEPDNICKCML